MRKSEKFKIKLFSRLNIFLPFLRASVSPLLLFSVSPLLLVSLSACQPNQSILKSSSQENSSPTAANASVPIADEPESFEAGLRGVRSGDYTFITAFRRKDGAAFDKDDRRFIKAIIPSETNQIVLTDGDRAVITGSNFVFPPDILKILRERFTVEDFSEKKNTGDNANAAAKNDKQ